MNSNRFGIVLSVVFAAALAFMEGEQSVYAQSLEGDGFIEVTEQLSEDFLLDVVEIIFLKNGLNADDGERRWVSVEGGNWSVRDRVVSVEVILITRGGQVEFATIWADPHILYHSVSAYFVTSSRTSSYWWNPDLYPPWGWEYFDAVSFDLTPAYW